MLPGLNVLPGENLHSGANCAHVQRLSLSYNYLAGSLINAATYKCADSPEGYGAFLRLFVCFLLVFYVVFVVCFFIICLIAVLSPRTKAKVMSGWSQITKTSPCNEHSLTPHFYIVKLGFTWVYFFFLFSLQFVGTR